MVRHEIIQRGNAGHDGQAYRGWFVGHFIEEKYGLRHNNDLELKWGVHSAGSGRSEWATGDGRTTVDILISGQMEVIFRTQKVTLKKSGDYVMYGKGEDHKSHIPVDSVVLTVRWPST